MVDGLCDVVACATRKTRLNILRFAAGCDEDDWSVPCDVDTAKHAAHFETAHFRHHHIEENQVGLLGDGHLQRFGSVLGNDDVVVLAENDSLHHERRL
jgi:hypothetical protein